MRNGNNPLQSASVESVRRLLDLFPIHALRSGWPDAQARLKEDLLLEIAGGASRDEVRDFVFDHIGCCHQYVHLFANGTNISSLPPSILPGHSPDATRATNDPRRDWLFILHVEYIVHLVDPYQRIPIPYLWPIKISTLPNFCVVQFVKLVKSHSSEFGDRHLRTEPPSINPSSIIGALGQSMDPHGGIRSLDFNKAIKDWVDDEGIDGEEVSLKGSKQTIRRTLNPDMTMKRDLDPEVYEEFKRHPLLKSRFRVIEDSAGLEVFACNPTRGIVNFPHVTKQGETRYVVEEILRRN